jgi:four helix bundle protein
MSGSIIADKSFQFAIRVVKLHKYLCQKNEFILSKQLLRSGTSIGANAHEAVSAQSTNDFIAKLSIALKEARETLYWLKLLAATEYLSEAEAETIIQECNELIAILTSIIKTTKKKRDVQ